MSVSQKNILEKIIGYALPALVAFAVSWGVAQQQLKAQEKQLEGHEVRIRTVENCQTHKTKELWLFRKI